MTDKHLYVEAVIGMGFLHLKKKKAVQSATLILSQLRYALAVQGLQWSILVDHLKHTAASSLPLHPSFPSKGQWCCERVVG